MATSEAAYAALPPVVLPVPTKTVDVAKPAAHCCVEAGHFALVSASPLPGADAFLATLNAVLADLFVRDLRCVHSPQLLSGTRITVYAPCAAPGLAFPVPPGPGAAAYGGNGKIVLGPVDAPLAAWVAVKDAVHELTHNLVGARDRALNECIASFCANLALVRMGMRPDYAPTLAGFKQYFDNAHVALDRYAYVGGPQDLFAYAAWYPLQYVNDRHGIKAVACVLARLAAGAPFFDAVVTALATTPRAFMAEYVSDVVSLSALPRPRAGQWNAFVKTATSSEGVVTPAWGARSLQWRGLAVVDLSAHRGKTAEWTLEPAEFAQDLFVVAFRDGAPRGTRFGARGSVRIGDGGTTWLAIAGCGSHPTPPTFAIRLTSRAAA